MSSKVIKGFNFVSSFFNYCQQFIRVLEGDVMFVDLNKFSYQSSSL